MPETKTKLSTLWMIVTLNIIFADIYSIIVQINGVNIMDIPTDVKTMMLIAVFLTNIPMAMIYLSRVLNITLNKRLNIGAAILTIVYIIGGAAPVPHYYAAAAIEVALLVYVIRLAWSLQDTPAPA